MKSKYLHEIDLARIAPMTTADQKRDALLGLKSGHAKFSYEAFRSVVAALFDAKKPMFDDLPAPTWEQIESAIKLKCGAKTEGIVPNLAVAHALFEHNKLYNYPATEYEFSAAPTGFGGRIKAWNDIYFIRDGKPTIAYTDPRRSSLKLTAAARQFLFSIMHHHLAVDIFSDAQFQILQFPADASGARTVKLYDFDKTGLIPLADLNRMISEVYMIWNEIQSDRSEKMWRKTGSLGS